MAAAVQVLSTNPVPFLLEDNHIQVRGTLNGRDVRLLLDTGATTVLASPTIATGLTGGTRIVINGFGDTGRGTARLCTADSIAVGPALAREVPVAIMPLPTVFDADGLLGFAFLKPLIVHLDFEQQRLCYPRSIMNSPDTSSVLPMQIQGPVPTVEAEIDGIPATLVVDTGASTALILLPGFIEQQRLRERYPKRLNALSGGGVLGEERREIARVQALKLGAFTLTNLYAEFNLRTNRAPGRISGFVGMEVLRRFHLTLDFPGQRLWLKPNAHFSDPMRLPAVARSGFACLPMGTNLVVRDVIADSPAAEAGIQVGDRVLAIDGRPTQSMKFAEMKRPFQASPGTAVRLLLASTNSPPRETTLVLRDLL